MSDIIITALISSSVTLLTTFIPLLLKYLGDKRKYQRELLDAEVKVNLNVSTGVAIGYYYNFIKPVFEKLCVNNEIDIVFDKKNPSEVEAKRTFYSNDVEILVILPSELTKVGIEEMREHAKKFKKGNILRKDGLRDFAIKFYTDDTNNRLIIVDVANPLNAVGQYLSNLEKFKNTIASDGSVVDGLDNQEFRIRQRMEIENFTEVIKHYARSEAYGDKKLLFQKV